MAYKNFETNFDEVRENRRLDRWIVNLADFFQTEKVQLLRLKALKEDQDCDFEDVHKDLENAIDNQLYEVFQTTIPSSILKKHNLTHRREDFDAVINIDPALIAKFMLADDDYISCYAF